mmetsp:Transcript_73410/g.128517  ORF Transcript_73410/g.128517 Transcript_73410/m.128517 type:complete len:441 (-) Transcript_73410:219-1541(-)
MPFSADEYKKVLDVVFIMGADYPCKYPWVSRCLDVLDGEQRNWCMSRRVTCFGLDEGGEPTIETNMSKSFFQTFLDSNHRRRSTSDKAWNATFPSLTRTSNECHHGVVMKAIEDTVSWFNGDVGKKTKTSGKLQVSSNRAAGQFAICFVFLGHALDCLDKRQTMSTLKDMLETVRRKFVFVPMLCEPELRLEALLLARLSGGFVVSPECEIDMFPLQLVKAASFLMKWYESSCGRDEKDVEEFLTGKYMEARASIFDGIEPPKSVCDHLKNLFVSISCRHRQVSLPGRPFPSCEDLFQCENHQDANDDFQVQSPHPLTDEGKIKVEEHQGELEQLKSQIQILEKQNHHKDIKIQEMYVHMEKQDARIEELAMRLEEMRIAMQDVREKCSGQKKRSPRGKRGGKKVNSQDSSSRHASLEEQGEDEDEEFETISVHTFDSWK